MAARGWQVLRLGEVETIDVAGVHWKPLRQVLGVEAFGVNAYVADAGAHVVEEHTEETLSHEEVYVVLTGRASFTIDGQDVEAGPGALLFVSDPALRRSAHALEDGTTVLAVGARPRAPYTPSAWEWFFGAERYRASGDTDAALALLADGATRHPDHPGILYATACWRALGGEQDAALEALQRAVELDPRCATWAQTDDDLVTLRGLAGFPTAP